MLVKSVEEVSLKFSFFFFFLILALRPQKPDKTQADPNSWIALECGAAEKFSATGSYKQDIPAAVYSNFDFMRAELESGYFAVQMVPDDQDDYGRKQLKKVWLHKIRLRSVRIEDGNFLPMICCFFRYALR